MKLNGVTYHSLASYPILAKVYLRAGWVVQSIGVPGEHDTLTIGGANQWVEPLHYNTRTFNSRESFFHFDVKQNKRYIHSMGAPFAEASDLYGISNREQRWAYTFVGTIKNSFGGYSPSGQDLDNAVVKTTIHEVGHQFGLAHHQEEDPRNTTAGGLLCAMDSGIPGPFTSFWFCKTHSGLLSQSNFPSTSPPDYMP